MKTLYLNIDNLKEFVGKGRRIESQIKFYRKDVNLYRIKDDVPSDKRFEVRVPDDFDLKKTGAYRFQAPEMGFVIADRKEGISFDAFKVEPQSYQKSLGIQDKLFDAMTRRQVGLLRYGKTLSQKMTTILKGSDQAIKERILGRLENWQGINSKADKSKLDTLLGYVEKDRSVAWVAILALFKEDVQTLALDENESYTEILTTVLPFVISDLKLTKSEVSSIVKTANFKQTPLVYWLDQIKTDDLRLVTDAVVTGATIGETEQEIAKRITGVVSLDGAGGVTKTAVNDLDSFVMSTVNLIPSAVRDAIIEKDDAVDKVVFVAVLDSRTTAQCRALDGKIYNKGKNPRPPLHIRCRSQIVPLINIDKALKEAVILKDESVYVGEFLGDTTITQRSDIPRGKKVAFDKWLKERLKQDMGTLNADITYEDWLRRQPVYFQDFTLGKAKGKLFREGGLGLDKFVNPDGGEITLSILANTQKQSFIQAGLDPLKYKD
jgi:SPP1 gp7 family putative phage head morphogenesis protein